MREVMLVFGTIALAGISSVCGFFYGQALEGILQKERYWKWCLLLSLGVLFFQAALFSWLPGRTGTAITMLDGYPSWNAGKCQHCMCCIRCGAVEYGLTTHGRKRYTHPDLRKKKAADADAHCH